tara:strand:+ start:312 stop:572 length:261 start_codon:yes stop_codon:yes gene_type:complete
MELSKNPKCIYKEVDNVGVILEPESGKFIELNKTALVIWNMLDKTNNLTDLKNKLFEMYETTECIEQDVNVFINNALKANIIKKLG